MLRELTHRSNSPLVALIPSGLATSPFWLAIPALGLSVAGLRYDLPMMTFLLPFAVWLVGASACLVVETIRGPRTYDPVVCLGVGLLAIVPFGLGYYASSITLLWAGSLCALAPVVVVFRSAQRSEPAPEKPPEIDPDDGVSSGEKQRTSRPYGFGRDGWFTMEYMPTYDDTNSVGNIYFANYIRIVGKCRELFFLSCMPDFDLRTTSFYILTNEFKHKFRKEVAEFDQVLVRLRIEKYNRRFVTLEHEILTPGGAVVGYGSQQLMFVARDTYKLLDIPGPVMQAFLPYVRTRTGEAMTGFDPATA